MARLATFGGPEQNSSTNDLQYSTFQNTPTAQTTTKRSGGYAWQSNKGATSGATVTYFFASANKTAAFYFRAYFYYSGSLPGSDSRIVQIQNASGTTKIAIDIKATTGELVLKNTEDTITVATGTTQLAASTWYCVELKVDSTTISSTALDMRLNGVSEGSGTANLTTGIARVRFGSGNNPSNINIFWDDDCINDSTGSFQNSWAGEGEVVFLRPNAAGDNNTFTSGTYADLDEVTPDDVTTHVTGGSGNIIDVNLEATPASMDSSDIINCVQVGTRYFDSDVNTKLRIKASSGGTVETSATLSDPWPTWSTNANATPRNYILTLYDLPGASTTAWTKSDLDSAQIGVDAGNGATDVSAIWLVVDHIANPAASTGNPTWPIFTGSKFWSPRFA